MPPPPAPPPQQKPLATAAAIVALCQPRPSLRAPSQACQSITHQLAMRFLGPQTRSYREGRGTWGGGRAGGMEAVLTALNSYLLCKQWPGGGSPRPQPEKTAALETATFG